MSIQISDIPIDKNACCNNKIIDAPPVALIRSDTGLAAANDGVGSIGTVDYRAIARAALSTTSDSVSEMDLFLTIFDSKPTAFTCISTLHQNGATDPLHFGFVLCINAQKHVRFRVNGWLSNGFKITNLQKRVNGTYVTIATMT
jgi:hypothetical protein